MKLNIDPVGILDPGLPGLIGPQRLFGMHYAMLIQPCHGRIDVINLEAEVPDPAGGCVGDLGKHFKKGAVPEGEIKAVAFAALDEVEGFLQAELAAVEGLRGSEIGCKETDVCQLLVKTMCDDNTLDTKGGHSWAVR